MQVWIATHCSVCRKSLGEGSVYLCESELYCGVAESNRILGWHRECCPQKVKDRYDEIARVEQHRQHEETG